MKMGGGPKQFGVDAEGGAGAAAPRSARSAWPSRAFTSSAARRTCAPKRSAKRSQKAFELALRLARRMRRRRCALLNIGGGFGIPYFPGRAAARPGADRRDNLDALAAARARRAAAGARSSIELGRYLVGEAGVYVCRVVDRKVSRGQVFLVTDGGLHHHLAASGNFGQVIRKNYPVAIGNRMAAPAADARPSTSSARCARRSTCWPTAWTLPRADVGDLVVVFQSGAYGPSASPSGFLGRAAAAEVLL